MRVLQLLAPGGLLMGDDWYWAGVRHDVLAFAQQRAAKSAHEQQPAVGASGRAMGQRFLSNAIGGGLNCTSVRAPFRIILCEPGGTWAMFKSR